MKAIAYRKCGKLGAVIAEELSMLGFATVTELRKRAIDATGANNASKISDTLKHMMDDGFFQQVRSTHVLITHDARQNINHHFATNPPNPDSKLKGKKLQEELAALVELELERQVDSHFDYDSLRRHLVDIEAQDGDILKSSVDSITEELYLSLDFSRVVTGTRNTIVSEQVRKALGEGSSKLAAAAMSQVGTLPPAAFGNAHSLALRDPDFEFINLHTLRERLSHSLGNKSNGSSRVNGHHGGTDKVNGMVNGGSDGSEDEELEDGLALIAEGRFSFVSHDVGTNTWKVDKLKLATWLRDQEIMKTISHRVGPLGLRLIRTLIDRGKLDERVIQELGLLDGKEMRQILFDLQQQGFVEIQEVPRDPQRTPVRTMYLFFFDAERVQRALLGDLYRTMARMYQRLRLEREKVQTTLVKVERSDVRGGEDELLSSAEMLVLQQFRRKEMWLMGEVTRLDESVAMLRDV